MSDYFKRPRADLNRHHDLADMLVRLHIAVSFRYLAQWKFLGDARLEISLLQMVDDVFLGFRPKRRHRDDLKYRVPAQRQSFWKRNQQRKRSWLHRQTAVFEDRST